MTGKTEKPPPRPAASYTALYPLLCEAVRPLGYALAIHGSMNRDMDLVAIPWVEDAADPEEVAKVITEQIQGFTGWDREPGNLKLHGRRNWLIWFKGVDIAMGGGTHIDLSIMPKAKSAGLKDHEIQELVNLLTAKLRPLIKVQSLREMIHGELVPYLESRSLRIDR